MKLIIFLLLISECLFARRFEINTLEVIENYDAKFLLHNSQLQTDSAVLDCQSFFQKYDFFDKHQKLFYENYITISECQTIFENTLHCLDQGEVKCIDTDDFFNASCKCSN